jgi:hypothetical protein
VEACAEAHLKAYAAALRRRRAAAESAARG